MSSLPPSQLIWLLKRFEELTPVELYSILRLRTEVFVVEQRCAFQETDNRDQQAWHLTGWNGSDLVAYSRILPAGTRFAEPSIGRVVTSPAARGRGLGKELMRRSLDELFGLFGSVSVRMGCQLYLKRFYESFGFVQDGKIYLEDGIEHIQMLRG